MNNTFCCLLFTAVIFDTCFFLFFGFDFITPGSEVLQFLLHIWINNDLGTTIQRNVFYLLERSKVFNLWFCRPFCPKGKKRPCGRISTIGVSKDYGFAKHKAKKREGT